LQRPVLAADGVERRDERLDVSGSVAVPDPDLVLLRVAVFLAALARRAVLVDLEA